MTWELGRGVSVKTNVEKLYNGAGRRVPSAERRRAGGAAEVPRTRREPSTEYRYSIRASNFEYRGSRTSHRQRHEITNRSVSRDSNTAVYA